MSTVPTKMPLCINCSKSKDPGFDSLVCLEPELVSPVDGSAMYAVAARKRCGVLRPIYFKLKGPTSVDETPDCGKCKNLADQISTWIGSQYFLKYNGWCDTTRSYRGRCGTLGVGFEPCTIADDVARIERLQKHLLTAQAFIRPTAT